MALGEGELVWETSQPKKLAITTQIKLKTKVTRDQKFFPLFRRSADLGALVSFIIFFENVTRGSANVSGLGGWGGVFTNSKVKIHSNHSANIHLSRTGILNLFRHPSQGISLSWDSVW